MDQAQLPFVFVVDFVGVLYTGKPHHWHPQRFWFPRGSPKVGHLGGGGEVSAAR